MGEGWRDPWRSPDVFVSSPLRLTSVWKATASWKANTVSACDSLPSDLFWATGGVIPIEAQASSFPLHRDKHKCMKATTWKANTEPVYDALSCVLFWCNGLLPRLPAEESTPITIDRGHIILLCVLLIRAHARTSHMLNPCLSLS